MYHVKNISEIREKMRLSQRRLALLAGVSYKTLQLLEAGRHDMKLSTLQAIANALGYPPRCIENRIENLFECPVDSIRIISGNIAAEGKSSWKLWLFNFVDAFRRERDPRYISQAPVEGLPARLKALLASTVEALCSETGIARPSWCAGAPTLDRPWFVAGVDNLVASSLLESPVYFRKRNIFVLSNFLERR